MNDLKINVLGEIYSIHFLTDEEDKSLINKNGYMDHTTNKIVIRIAEKNIDSLEDLAKWSKKILMHEIIHAFMIESGLYCAINSIHSEQNVDWMASQIGKIWTSYMLVDNEINNKLNEIYSGEEKNNESM